MHSNVARQDTVHTTVCKPRKTSDNECRKTCKVPAEAYHEADAAAAAQSRLDADQKFNPTRPGPKNTFWARRQAPTNQAPYHPLRFNHTSLFVPLPSRGFRTPPKYSPAYEKHSREELDCTPMLLMLAEDPTPRSCAVAGKRFSKRLPYLKSHSMSSSLRSYSTLVCSLFQLVFL